MLKPRSLLTVSAAVTLTAALKIASGQAGATPAQPKVEARDAPLLRIANLTFKDLNRNGSLDPYEDWRLPVEKRVADLLSRMTMEEGGAHADHVIQRECAGRLHQQPKHPLSDPAR
jgi:beta-glucosidase